MTVYYVTIFLVTISLCLAQNADYAFQYNNEHIIRDHSVSSRIFFCISIVILIFVAGFRYGIGTDYFSYYRNYSVYAGEFINSIKNFDEPGFKLICWCVQKLGGDGATVIFVAAALTISLCMKTIYKQSEYLVGTVMLLIFTGFWHTEFNAVRQCLAAAIIFSGIKYIKNRNFWKYFIVVAIASLFHISAIIMILLYLVPNLKMSLGSILLLVGGALIILQSFDVILRWTGVLLNTSFADTDEYITSSVNIFRVLVAISPPVFFFIMYWRQELNDEQKDSLQFLVINAVLMLATSNSTYLARIGIYTMPFVALSIPRLIDGLEERNKTIVKIGVYLLFALYWYYEVSNSSSLNNFRFIWDI